MKLSTDKIMVAVACIAIVLFLNAIAAKAEDFKKQLSYSIQHLESGLRKFYMGRI